MSDVNSKNKEYPLLTLIEIRLTYTLYTYNVRSEATTN